GVKVVSGHAGNLSHKGMTIGADGSGNYGTIGNISELIFFNAAISSADSAAVMEYLQGKYSGKRLLIDHRIPVDYGFAPVTYTAECDWAQSFLWDDGTVGPTVVISDEKTHFLTVTDKFGFASSDFIVVDYPKILQPDQNTTICAGDTLVWDAALSGPYTYLWNNGSTESSLEITTAGEYFVTITDTAGYSWKSETITVSIDSFPVMARLESENIEACIGNNIYLQNGYDEAVNYLWSDGTSADHLTVATTGTYWVKVADRLGCVATDTAHIEVLGIAPTPDFTHTALCATRSIEFSNQSHSNDASQINGYLWQFGDGQTSAEASPAHAYSYSGTYNLQLTVSTTNGCRNLLKKTLIIDSLPTAAFMPEQACSFTTVQFADQSTTPVSYITDWQWTMNDSTFAVRNPSTTFNTWGDKPVQLVVATAHGCTDTLRGSISILQGPAVDFTMSEPCLNTPLYCTNRTIGALNLAVGYVWQIDGEERSTVKSPDFNFSDTGSYRITLTAKQLSNGCSASKSKTISIKPLPKPVIAAGLICHNQPTAVSAGNIEPQSVVRSWQWSVDGVQSAKKQSAWLTFESVGRHHLTVAATDTVGCVSKTDTTVVVRPTPAAAFGVAPERGPVPFEPRIINNTTDADSYLWLLSDGETSDAEEPQHTFADSGSHVIRLVATNQFGCADTALRTIVAFVPNTDLLIMQATAEPVGNYLRISAVVANNSPYDLVNTTISCTDNLGHSMRETITDTLKSGKIVQYTFAAEIESAANLLKYICVNVEPAIGNDANPADNQFCIAMVSDEFSIEPAKPNPANNLLKISYIVPQEGHVKIELFNQVGMSAATLFDGTAASGYNELLVDASVLKSGMYHYRITYGGRSRVGVVMIMHHR
ncbi:MAG: PKD domain-containing protein, partial [Salinivirgaceae bacterium]|nr:PKD domain-containing protein [Salinivirgaceae bacterium]